LYGKRINQEETVTPPSSGDSIPATAFHQLPYWKDLPAEKRKSLVQQSQELDRTANPLEQGRHIYELHAVLKEQGRFLEYMDAIHHKISKKSVYRYKDTWEIASQFWPLPFLQAMMELDVDPGLITIDSKIGKFTSIVRDLGGIPQTEDKGKQIEFVGRLLEAYKTWRAEVRWPKSSPPPDELAKRVFKQARVQFRKMREESRKDAVTKLVAWLAAEFKVDVGTVRPAQPPASLRDRMKSKGQPNV
jgi:hypothetical protein